MGEPSRSKSPPKESDNQSFDSAETMQGLRPSHTVLMVPRHTSDQAGCKVGALRTRYALANHHS